MSHYMICPNCGKGTIGRYATDDSLCGECSDNSSTTDKLSVEKLQEHLLPYKKETVQKIIDEKMQLVTADEFLKLHKESLTAIRENDKLQEQLNTAKKALTEIRANIEEHNQIYDLSVDTALLLEGIDGIAFEALAAIGGDDGQ